MAKRLTSKTVAPHKGEGLAGVRRLRQFDVSTCGDDLCHAGGAAGEAPPPCGEGLGRGILLAEIVELRLQSA
ncbi:hypothetical protein ABIA18_004092 [Sinorhizobium fredii]